eukprot:403368045
MLKWVAIIVYYQTYIVQIQNFGVFQKSCDTLDDLQDGVVFSDILIQVERDHFTSALENLKIFKRDHQMEEKLNNLQVLHNSLSDYYHNNHNVDLKNDIDIESIVISKEPNESLIRLFELVIGVVVSCQDKDFYIKKILELDDETQYNLGLMIEKPLRLINGQYEDDDQDEDNAGSSSQRQDDNNSNNQMFQNKLGQMNQNASANANDGNQQIKNFYPESPDKDDFDELELQIQMQRKDEKIEELYQQIATLDKDRVRVRGNITKYEEENKSLTNQFEEAKIEIAELKKQMEIYENKLHSNLDVREDKINTQQSEIKELEAEIELKNKKIRELLKEKTAAEKRFEEDYQTLRDELDVSKEKIIQLSKNEAIIEVYKKKIGDMAQIKSDLKDMQDRNQRLVESLEILEKEKENNKNLKEYVQYLEEQLNSVKSKYDILEISSKKHDKKIKDLTGEKSELEKKNQFYKETIDQLESEVKKTNNELKQVKYDETRLEDGALLPESIKANMREKIKQLEKENSILRQELENKFDKDKAIMQSKLQDALRENEKLEQSNFLMNEQLNKLQEKVSNSLKMDVYQNRDQQFNEINQDIKSIIKDRDQYFLKMTQNDIIAKQSNQELEKLKEDISSMQQQLQKLTNEKSEYYHQFLQEKEKIIAKQEENHRLEGEITKLQVQVNQSFTTQSDNSTSIQSQALLDEVQQLRDQEKLLREELLILKATQSNAQTTSQSAAQHQEIIEKLVKQNEEIQLNSIVNEMKLEIKDKENLIKDLQRDLDSKERLFQLDIDKLNHQLSLKDMEIQKVKELSDKEVKLQKESGLGSKRLLDNMRREQTIMSGVFHKMAYEMYTTKTQQQ